MSHAVETENLTKVFNGFVAVNGVTLRIRRGSIFGLLGPNGAGKSTLLRMICTLLRPTAGRAFVEGHDVVREPNEVRRTIGVVQEKLLLYPVLTARENLELFGRLYGIEGEELRRRIRELLEEVKLWGFRDKPVGTFSSGMRQRLNIVRALMHDPSVIILDEPTNALDPQSVRWVRDYVKGLRDRGLTVVVTTHDMHEAEELSEDLAIMDRGQVLDVGPVDQLKSKYGASSVEDVFLKLTGRELRDELSGRISARGWR
ncbi:MAG: ABC transporter ATP-binding protein [Conexivisphaera sp.]|jgi:ABC-2 type transport system ATP-binding protein